MTDATTTTPLTAELVWAGGQKFGATSGSTAIVLDGDGVAGPSPMQVLAEALAGCMAIDLVMILTKGRHPLKTLRVSFSLSVISMDSARASLPMHKAVADAIIGRNPESARAR